MRLKSLTDHGWNQEVFWQPDLPHKETVEVFPARQICSDRRCPTCRRTRPYAFQRAAEAGRRDRAAAQSGAAQPDPREPSAGRSTPPPPPPPPTAGQLGGRPPLFPPAARPGPGRVAAHLRGRRAPLANGRNGSNGSSLPPSPRGSSAGTQPLRRRQTPDPRRPSRPCSHCAPAGRRRAVSPPTPPQAGAPGRARRQGRARPSGAAAPLSHAGRRGSGLLRRLPPRGAPRGLGRPHRPAPPCAAPHSPHPVPALHAPGRRRRQPPPAPQHGAARQPAPTPQPMGGRPASPAPLTARLPANEAAAFPSPRWGGAPSHRPAPSALGLPPPIGAAEGAPPPASQWGGSGD